MQVRSRCEKRVALLLLQKGYEAFLPLHRSRRFWSDRVKEVELPLFPGYFFCRFELPRTRPILTTPGVLTIVEFGREPAAIADSEIANIKAIVRSGCPTCPWEFLQTGQLVRIENGPLRGVEGLLVDSKGLRVVVSVTLLQRSIAVEVNRAWVKPIGDVSLARSPISTMLRSRRHAPASS